MASGYQQVTFIIDGARVRAPKGSSVLDTAMEYGVCIPHLCHLPNLSDLGGCRLCIVENVVERRARITTSCTLRVQEDMVIRSNTDQIKQLRKNIAELLVAEAPNSRAVQDVALRCGVTEVRYPFRNKTCVLCGRCVRLCTELWQAQAIGFVGRGKDRQIDFPFGERPDFCKHCWSCVQYCPMTITPCGGPMKAGEERLCGQCEAQLIAADRTPDACIWCDLGRGFACTRHVTAGTAMG